MWHTVFTWYIYAYQNIIKISQRILKLLSAQAFIYGETDKMMPDCLLYPRKPVSLWIKTGYICPTWILFLAHHCFYLFNLFIYFKISFQKSQNTLRCKFTWWRYLMSWVRYMGKIRISINKWCSQHSFFQTLTPFKQVDWPIKNKSDNGNKFI